MNTILYVDDDNQVREAVAEIIRLTGFDVLLAADAGEAMRILAGSRVDLLLTDVAMYGLTGFELAQQAKTLQPNLRVLYITGYEEHASGRERLVGKILRKPLRASQIIAEIRAALKD